MSTATTLQLGALHLPQAHPRPTRKAHAAVPQRMGKGALLGPLQALVEARMRKAEIELEFAAPLRRCSVHKHRQGGANLLWHAVLQSGDPAFLSRMSRIWKRAGTAGSITTDRFTNPSALRGTKEGRGSLPA